MWNNLILAVTLSVLLTEHTDGAAIKRQSGTEPAPPVCNSEFCHQTAERVQQSINPDVDPCENFYEFACGGWMANNPIPESSTHIDTWKKLRSDVSDKVKALLSQPIKSEDLEAVQKIKTFYISCMDEELQNKLGPEPMLDLLGKIGDWPLMRDKWEDDDYDLIDLLLKTRYFNRKFLITLEVTPDLLDGDVRIIRMDQAGLGMGRNQFLASQSATAIPAFKKYAHDVAKALGAENEETLNNDIEDMVNFAVQLANITDPSSQRRYISQVYNKMTLAELYTNISDKFDWYRYIEGVLSFGDFNEELSKEEPVMVLAKNYFIKLIDLLDQTPKRAVVNYVMWLMVKSTVSQLSHDFRLIALDYLSAISGVTQLSERSAKCVASVSLMSDVSGRMFIDTYFDETSKEVTEEMIAYLRTAFNEMLIEIDWMDDETRVVAEEKANAMNHQIGYSDHLLDDARLNAQYDKLKYDPAKYFENILQGAVFTSNKYLKLLRIPVDKLAWTKKATMVNAYYNSLGNRITFPAGILQPPFFHKSYPKSMNYGGIGMLIGHEITHGFDDRGRQFDKDGNFVQWWSDDVIERFQNETDCIIEQYGTYFVPEANMTADGYRTQGENIADNGGLREAYKAYNNWLNEGLEEDPVLPDLPYDRRQLFFLNFAQSLCQNLRPSTAVNRILRSVHSLERIRVTGTLRNFPAFSEAFNCPASSYMLAEHRCRVW